MDNPEPTTPPTEQQNDDKVKLTPELLAELDAAAGAGK